MKLLQYLYLSPGGFTLPYMLGICKFVKEHYDINKYNFINYIYNNK